MKNQAKLIELTATGAMAVAKVMKNEGWKVGRNFLQTPKKPATINPVKQKRK